MKMVTELENQYKKILPHVIPGQEHWKEFAISSSFLILLPATLVYIIHELSQIRYFNQNEYFVEGQQELSSLTDTRFFNFFGILAILFLGFAIIFPKRSWIAQTASRLADSVFSAGMMGLGAILGQMIVLFWSYPKTQWPNTSELVLFLLGSILVFSLNLAIFLIKTLTTPLPGFSCSPLLEFLAKNPSKAQILLGTLFVLCPIWAISIPKQLSLLLMIVISLGVSCYIIIVKRRRMPFEQPARRA